MMDTSYSAEDMERRLTRSGFDMSTRSQPIAEIRRHLRRRGFEVLTENPTGKVTVTAVSPRMLVRVTALTVFEAWRRLGVAVERAENEAETPW
jgi:hypothetical protein